jgi:competence protein ComEC
MPASFVKKFPAVITVIPIVIGILISYYSRINLSVVPSVYFVIILTVLIILIIYLYKTIIKGELFLFSYIALLVFYGMFSFQFRYFKTGDDNINVIINEVKNKNTVLKGIIIEQPEIKDDKIRILLKSESVDSTLCSGLVLATVYKNKFKESIIRNYQYGDEIEITGRLENLPHQKNPGEFDYGEYLKLHNVNAVFTSFGYSKINLIGQVEQSFFKTKVIYPVKDYSIGIIDKLIGGDGGEYLKGLVLGERSNISREIKENFVNAGVAHIIAVSGLNVAYVIIIIWGVLTFIPVKHSYKIIITIIFARE